VRRCSYIALHQGKGGPPRPIVPRHASWSVPHVVCVCPRDPPAAAIVKLVGVAHDGPAPSPADPPPHTTDPDPKPIRRWARNRLKNLSSSGLYLPAVRHCRARSTSQKAHPTGVRPRRRAENLALVYPFFKKGVPPHRSPVLPTAFVNPPAPVMTTPSNQPYLLPSPQIRSERITFHARPSPTRLAPGSSWHCFRQRGKSSTTIFRSFGCL